MMTDASEMLAAALEQMDGIIAGSKAMDFSHGVFDCQSPTSPFLGSLRVLHLLEDLQGALENMDREEREALRCQVPDATAGGLAEWLKGQLTNGHSSIESNGIYRERLSRIESDKECLVLQVSVLTDQVEVQGEKIKDLDMCLEERREKLNSTEGMLQQELLSRAALEKQKAELLAEVSDLKRKLNVLERDCRDGEGLFQEVNDLRFRVTDMENERLRYERELKSAKQEVLILEERLQEREEELKRLQDTTPVGVTTLDATDAREKDFDRMQRVMESLMATNDKKDREIEGIQPSVLTQYTHVHDMYMKNNGDSKGGGSPFFSVAEDLERAAWANEEDTGRSFDEQSPRCALQEAALLSTSTPEPALVRERDAVTTPTGTKNLPDVPESGGLSHITGSTEEDGEEVLKERSLESSPTSPASTSPSQPNSAADGSFGTKKSRSSFGRGFFKIRGGKRTSSAPSLAENEGKGTEHLDLAGVSPQRVQGNDCTHTVTTSPEGKKKPRGLKKLFGRMKKSQSSSLNLDNPSDSQFKRGGVRATAGPRLGWSREPEQGSNERETPFARWTKEQVLAWLQEQGLGAHMGQAQQWIRSGQTLLQASQHDLEKELGLKHLLHKKKLHLALQALGSEEDDLMGKLDHNWVTRWLDDIGLPQYKSNFDEAWVDGRMLHYMTVDDLLSLKVGSVLHHLSIKRAIQVLRLNRYDPSCLRRRPSDENNVTPAEISQWTNHRVMEWLRSADLAEYAPNLRGSGVHGGLMVLEPHFTVETLALLLNIPPSKSLLRRHLATHFHLLIGPEAQRLKQEWLENPDCVLLTATAKVKPRRMSFGSFGTLRRKRQEDSEYICPMDVEMPRGSSFLREQGIYEELDQMDDSEGTVRQIGAFSEGINNLTSMLKDEEFFGEMSPDASATDEDSNA